MNDKLRRHGFVAGLLAWSLLGALAPASRGEPIHWTVAVAAAPETTETKDETAKEAAPNGEKKESLGQRSEREVTLGDELKFREQQVHSEMNELEQRMFRLSETLKKLEPENSSRLMLGFKYAREELILHQMQEVEAALGKLSLKGAAEEQKQLLAKLERLQQLLLSSDLDFEMRIARLRAIRDTLRKLDAVVKEESREEKQSKKSAQSEKKLAELAKRRETLEKLIKQQSEHIDNNAPLAKQNELGDEDKSSADKLKEAQESTRQETKALADELQDGAASKPLASAVDNMQAAVDSLGKPSPSEAQPKMEAALENLKEELADVAKQEAAAKEALKQENLAAMRSDQQTNRGATDEVAEMTRQLGASGTGALPELLRASGSMSSAEGAFGSGQAGEANGEQGKALASLRYASELLAEEADRLARELRGEVKKKVTEGLTAMLEMQVAVRERTVALAPGVKEGSREALSGVTALAKRQEKITGTAQDLINIVEETEFGIALPAALAAVRDAAEGVQMSLAEGDASSDTVKAEKQIEADLKAMLEVVKEMSDANSKSGRRGGNSMEDQRKERNRIISELKMIRLLQLRVHESTTEVDGKRGTASVPPNIRKRIEDLEGRQDDIRDATELLANERAEDLPQP